MKHTFLLGISFATVALIALSNASGPANNNNGNKTGGPTATGTCTSCHNGASGTTANITAKKKSDNTDANGKYIPGETYLITLEGNHSSLSLYGFQLTAVKTDNTQGGTWQSLSSDVHTKTVSGINIIEQHHPLSKTSGAFTTTVEWVAPAAGTGSVGFHGIINAVNGDNQVSGDAVSAPVSLTLAENGVGVKEVAKQRLSVYPNPVTNMMQVEIPINMIGLCNVEIISLEGKAVQHVQLQALANEKISLPCSQLPNGVYYLSIYSKEAKHSSLFLKQ